MPRKGSYLTKEGLAKLEAELLHLHTVRRRGVADRIQKAKEIGGTVDNAEYDDSKNEQAFVEGRILTLEQIIGDVIIIGGEDSVPNTVRLGARVAVVNQNGREEEYTIVGTVEADPMESRISNESPVGKALLGKKVGEDVQVTTPAGAVTLTIVGIG